MDRTTPTPAGASAILGWAERNLRQLALLAARDMDRAASAEERDELAMAGLALARARQHILLHRAGEVT